MKGVVMLIDAHHHLLNESGYVDKLVAECRRLGIGRVCLFAGGKLGKYHNLAENEDVLRAMEKHPGTIIAFAVFDLGDDRAEKIDEFVRQGFRGVKFINPRKNYDDPEFYPVYARLEKAGIPAIFHLGIVARSEGDGMVDVRNERHRPIHLDSIARAFPGLNIIGAHFGNPWYEEAAMAARWNPNLYFDLSGSTLKCKSPKFIGDLLWWTPTTRYKDPMKRYAWEKIVFGSDVPAGEIEDVLNDYRRTMSELRVSAEIQAKVLGSTMAKILKIQT